MNFAPRRLAVRTRAVLVVVASAFALAACASQPQKASSKKPTRSKEYFAESEYGVKASPRVTSLASNLPRGGGRDQLGKPYKVRGKWYHPKEDPNYRNTGMASWYGDAFHGRLTANGEIYDMTHLTAAHPTMPLPSYARVTNAKNGSSVIVRVNDRGPFHSNRVIDLSRRAAELLDYTNAGVAQVKVEYLGRAPLHGQDDQFLMASYRPAGRAPDPSDGMATGVMIAMAGPTPSVSVGQAPVFPGQMRTSTPSPVVSFGEPDLPALGPVVPERPGFDVAAPSRTSRLPVLSYADRRVAGAAAALETFAERGGLTEEAITRSWSSTAPGSERQISDPYVAAGTFATMAEAEALAAALATVGRATIETDPSGDGYSVVLRPDGRGDLDAMLRHAWAAGADGAMTVRE